MSHNVISKKVTLRGGFYYDRTSAINKDLDTVRSDADKTAISTDSGIKLSKHFNIDLAYQFSATKGSGVLPMDAVMAITYKF